jgi:hypothetical protein
VARRKGRRKSSRRASRKRSNWGGKNGRFAKAARACHVQLRAGDLPAKGDFKRCMKSELK